MAGFFMVIGALIMLGAGGCSIWGFAVSNQLGGPPMFYSLVLMIGGIPFFIGLAIFKAASRASDMKTPKKPPIGTKSRSQKPPVNSFGFTPEDRKKD